MQQDPNQSNWKRVFDQVPLDVAPGASQQERAKQRALESHRGQDRIAKHTKWHTQGQFLMKYRIPHSIVAATIVAVFFWMNHSNSSTALAVEEVVEKLNKATTARFKMVVQPAGLPEQKMTAYYLAPSRFRQELDGGHINIVDWNARKVVGLNTKERKATILRLTNVSPEADQKHQKNQFELIRDLLNEAMTDPNSKVETLGKKQVDGRQLTGFRFRSGESPVTVWADSRTGFPVRIESLMVGPPETRVVMSDYEFNVALEQSLFSLDVPEGYEVLETTVDGSLPTEQEFVNALKSASESMNGKLPAGFDGVAIASYVGAYVRQQRSETEDDLSPFDEKLYMGKTVALARGLRFALTLPKEADAHYAGQNMRAGDSESPIFWYKPQGANTYRVMFADFSIKNAEVAPVVEGARRLKPVE